MPPSVPIYYIEFFPALYFLHKNICQLVHTVRIFLNFRWNQLLGEIYHDLEVNISHRIMKQKLAIKF